MSETRDAVVSNNRALLHDVGQIYRLLGQHSEQLRELQHAIENQHRSLKNLSPHSKFSEIPGDAHNEQREQQYVSDQDSCISTIFFDCVSRFSPDDLDLSDGNNQLTFLGTPQYAFEQNASFHPEGYTLNRPFERLLVFAVLETRKSAHTLECFLLYAATPRRWHRIHAYVTIKKNSENNEDTDGAITFRASHYAHANQPLPKMLLSTLEDLLLETELFDPVTRVHALFSEGPSGEMLYDPRTIRSAEDYEEIDLINEEDKTEELQDLRCVEYRESEVATICPQGIYVFIVCVKHRRYLDRRAPFAYAGHHKTNRFKTFFQDLKLMHFLRGCPGVAQFAGVVLDDSGKHLKGYLYEHASYKLQNVLSAAEFEGKRIQWPLREEWAKQTLEAIAHLHGKGLVIGSLCFFHVNLRENGTVILTHLQNSIQIDIDSSGRLPPEVREARKNLGPNLEFRPNFRTDVFQLGKVLWQLGEHVAVIRGFICAKSGCLHFPRYTCTDHTNPVALPIFSEETIPSYFQEMIRQCRAWLPKDRPPAWSLLDSITRHTRCNGSSYKSFDNSWKAYINPEDHYNVHCDNCGARCSSDHFHCRWCDGGDFDICLHCVNHGVHCMNKNHKLQRRSTKNGRVVERD